jgi:hypothetical protein
VKNKKIVDKDFTFDTYTFDENTIDFKAQEATLKMEIKLS